TMTSEQWETVDYDPFAHEEASQSEQWETVDYDPFAGEDEQWETVDYDPFAGSDQSAHDHVQTQKDDANRAAFFAAPGAMFDGMDVDPETHQAPIAQYVADYPLSAWRTAKALGVGAYDAIANQAPKTFARLWRGSSSDDLVKDRETQAYIDQQDKESQELQSKYLTDEELQDTFLFGLLKNKSAYEGARNLFPTAASMGSGIGAGALAGSAFSPGVGTVVGAVAGGLSGGTIGYSDSKNEFLESALKDFYAKNPNATDDEATSYLDEMQRIGTRIGLWEAVPEAASQIATMGLARVPLGGIPGLNKFLEIPWVKKYAASEFAETATGKALANIGKGGVKLGAEMGEEHATEFATFMGQESEKYHAGLRETEPTLQEYMDTQGGSVSVMAALGLGTGSAMNHFLPEMHDAKNTPDKLNGELDLDALNMTGAAGFTKGNAMSRDDIMNWVTSTRAGLGLYQTLSDLYNDGHTELATKIQVTSADRGEHVEHSKHYTGDAVDINRKALTEDEQELFAQYAAQNGLSRDVKGEPWHYSYVGKGAVQATERGARPKQHDGTPEWEAPAVDPSSKTDLLHDETPQTRDDAGWYSTQNVNQRYDESHREEAPAFSSSLDGMFSPESPSLAWQDENEFEKLPPAATQRATELASYVHATAAQQTMDSNRVVNLLQQLDEKKQAAAPHLNTLSAIQLALQNDHPTQPLPDDAATPPFPESSHNIAAQLEAIQNPQSGKRAMLVTPGSPLPTALPKGVHPVATQHGTILTTDHVLRDLIPYDIDEETLGKVVLGAPSVRPAPGSGVVAQALDDKGRVISETQVDPSQTEEAVQAMQDHSPTGHTRVISTGQALQERHDGFLADQVRHVSEQGPQESSSRQTAVKQQGDVVSFPEPQTVSQRITNEPRVEENYKDEKDRRLQRGEATSSPIAPDHGRSPAGFSGGHVESTDINPIESHDVSVNADQGHVLQKAESEVAPI
ncbi:hypothetical protein, partial [Desulfovibrio inopinatus]|uniref:hypothetical protein n=1 Tax=Desulfovibrio inopinatus TaxID=102109 RepID=UPI003CCC3256